MAGENMGMKLAQWSHTNASRSWTVDTSQYPEARNRAGSVVPTLMRSSTFYNFQMERGMMPLEVMLTQGILVREESMCVCVCVLACVRVSLHFRTNV